MCIHTQARLAWFQETLVKWVNRQPLVQLLTCVGDGHSGIWNLMKQFNPLGETREILDWFHLVENLYKVGGSNRRIYQGKKLLWQGKVDETLALFSPLNKKQAQNFCVYLNNHLSFFKLLVFRFWGFSSKSFPAPLFFLVCDELVLLPKPLVFLLPIFGSIA